MTKADGSFQKNHYDAEGLRAEMEENGQLVKFLYNEDREAVAEEESDGNVIRYIRGLGLISSDSEKAKTYYHYVSDEQGSITHVINGEEKESGELPQEDVQSRVLNHYEYDAFGNTIRCEEQVHNRFHYTGEQYDPLTGQYSLRARYYNPVIAGFTQEDTYYGDGLNLYTYCQNNPILYHDPTGHGTKENSPYSRNEQQYIDVGADPDTARLVAQCYPDAKSKQDLYNKYKKQGYSAQDAKKLANREIIHGEEATKKYIKDNNVKKSDPDYTATSPRDNVNTDWRTQERLNAQRNAGAGKGNESGNKSGSGSVKNWKGQEVKIPDGHIMSSRDPDFSEPPIYREGPYTDAQRNAFLQGKSGDTKTAPHHRHQIPVRDGGVIDEIPGPGHPEGNQHTGGSPNRHPNSSIFNSESNGNRLRNSEIRAFWKAKGKRLIPDGRGGWIDPGY
ncbi:MAG: RHS repeat-associated core domain-containing protein [Waltera sp.]